MAEFQDANADQTDDMLKAQRLIKSIVDTTLAEQRAQEDGRQQQREAPVVDEDEGRKRFKEMLDPYIRPEVNQARLESMAAVDESRFYRKHPEAVEYEDQVEKIFNESMKRGQPWQREDIHKYLVGKEATENPEKFVEKMTERKQRQLREAEYAGDMGAGGMQRSRDESRFKDFKSKTLEEMEKDLEGITF